MLQGDIARGGMGAVLKVWYKDQRGPLATKVILGTSESAGQEATPMVVRREQTRARLYVE